MPKMPYDSELDVATSGCSTGETASSDWRKGLPTLRGSVVTLRELRASDAASLCALLTTEETTRFISAPPATVDGFERFIGWTLRQRIAGTSVCYAITVPASTRRSASSRCANSIRISRRRNGAS